MSKRKPFFTDSVKRFAGWNIVIFITILLIFNVFLLISISSVLHESIDIRLKHEIENVAASLKVQKESIEIISFLEFNEPDLTTITEIPFFLQIYDYAGNLIIGSKNLKLFKPIPKLIHSFDDKYYAENLTIDDENLRIGYVNLTDSMGNKVALLQLATPENQFNSIMGNIVTFNLFSIPVIILIVIAASIFLAKKSYSPINKIIETANRISARNLLERIEYKANPDDELGRLRDTLNKLFTRIELHINQLSRFTDHASHQLMNPLTAVKTELEYILKRERTSEEYKSTLEKLFDQSDKMIEIVKTLLLISKQDSIDKGSKSVFNVSNLIENRLRDEFRNVPVDFSLEDELYLYGAGEKFNIILENLLDNAVKYSPEKSKIKLILYQDKENTIISVEDSGIGIPDDEKEKIFERFYRTINSEKIGIKGYGLGLSLVKILTEEAGGTITVSDNHPVGTIITLKFPSVLFS